MLRLLRFPTVCLGLLLFLGSVHRIEATPPRVPVLVELFTSEGCSSCPPADALLARLMAQQPVDGAEVIGLSEHVDYWNRLGWTDPYSSPGATARQREYVEAFDLDSAYTPQMVVAGRWQFTGSRGGEALAAVANAAREPQARMALEWRGDGAAPRLEVRVDALPETSPGDVADVLLAVSESDLVSSVASGENAGSELRHTGVVRDLRRLGSVKGSSFRGDISVELAPSWHRPHLRAVAFVQERHSRRILGAAAIALPAERRDPGT